MAQIELAYRVSVEEACAWLESQTGMNWDLPELIKHGLTPYVWLDFSPEYPELFGDATGGFAAPIFYEGDTQRLAEGSEDVLITFTKDSDKIAIQLKPPGIRAPLQDVRFLKKDLTRLLEQLRKPKVSEKTSMLGVSESKKGINKEQVLLAFSALVKFNLENALDVGDAIFGDEGARVKSSAKIAKNKRLWNPVTLALGLNEAYRVPMSRLKRSFLEHEFLIPWQEQWNQSLELLGE
jgi:hypothetical protein